MWRAYVDESEPYREPNTYILAAALIDDADVAELRRIMVALRPTAGHRRKLHWHEESGRVRAEISKTISQAPVMHVVVVRSCAPTESSERRRRKCLQRLTYELLNRRVLHIVAEARERKSNLRELDHFNRLRAARTIDSRMRIDHVKVRAGGHRDD